MIHCQIGNLKQRERFDRNIQFCGLLIDAFGDVSQKTPPNPHSPTQSSQLLRCKPAINSNSKPPTEMLKKSHWQFVDYLFAE
jgi:hypothetical protein